MASIRKRNGKWQAQIRRKGQPTISKSFHKKADARAWAIRTEHQTDGQELAPKNKTLDELRLRDLLIRYRDEVSTTKRGGDVEHVLINAFLKLPIANKPLSAISRTDFIHYRNKRLKAVKPQTIKRQFTVLSSVFKIAKEEWEIPVSNPVHGIKLQYIDERRNRRLRPGELDKLLEAATSCNNPYIKPVILIAIETGMRRGEILAIQWIHIDLNLSVLTIPVSKNGFSRTIPLTPSAKDILVSLDREHQHVFPITANALRKAWERVKTRASINDLRFHDLRHEAISRFFEMGLNIAEVASISGHRDFKMLFRYTHPKAEDIVNKFKSL